MAVCSFCASQIRKGTGKIFVRKDGSVLFFCAHKCEKNMLKLGRAPERVRWTGTRQDAKHAAARQAGGKKAASKPEKTAMPARRKEPKK